jgi:hypothetical protein
VRILEALKILEDAALDCKKRSINTPEVNEALNVIERYVDTEWRVRSFRDHLDRHPQTSSVASDGSEGQQQNLRVHFGGIYRCVRAAMIVQLSRLTRRYLRLNKDPAIKAEIDRLNTELEKMPVRWRFG